MSILERFKDITLYADMPMEERLLATLYVAMLGMGITFLVLIFLQYLFTMTSKFFNVIPKPEAKPKVKEANIQLAVSNPVEVQETENAEELTAVIAAAIASILNQGLDTFVVRHIERLPDPTPVWSKAGRSEQMSSRR